MFWTAGFRAAVISPYEQVQLTEPRGFADQTVRQVLHMAGGGERLRVRLANRYGRTPLTIVYTGDAGWSLTEAGKTHGELQLVAELDATSARGEMEAVYEEFLPVNYVVAAACAAWQLTEMGIGDKSVTLASTIAALQEPARVLAGLEDGLTTHLSRFAGYHHRFTAALAKAAEEAAWVTATDRDSCHRVWFELHEDLIATLGLTR